MSSTQHIKALDGVRGLAVIAVVFCHMSSIVKDIPQLSFISDGWAGVELFFVLSGFLITSILMRARQGEKYYRNFYYRRAMRIWPLYYIYILAMYGLFWIIPHTAAYQNFVAHSDYLRTHPPVVRTPLVLSLLFTQNLWWPSLFASLDMVSITWSLCIEEQFYLLWPFFVKNFTVCTLRNVLIGVLVLEPFLRMIVFHLPITASQRWQTVYRFPLFHLDSISAGSLLALIWKKVEHKPQTRPVLFALFFLSLVPCYFLLSAANAWVFSAATLLSVSIVGLALADVWNRFFTLRPLTYFGAISYGLYLIHPTVFDAFQSRSIYLRLHIPLSLEHTELLAATVGFVASVALATLSRYTLEAWFLRLKDRRSTGARGALQELEVHSKA